MRVGLLSDTHSFLHERALYHLESCDEIWHAGDVGDYRVIERLEMLKPLRGVYGNIDDAKVRSHFPEHLLFEIEGVKVFMTHIGGTPPNYAKGIKAKIKNENPKLFICGHSHILRVMPDPNLNNMLYMNPGAAGNQGFHKTRTILRFDISNGTIKNLEVIELGQRGT